MSRRLLAWCCGLFAYTVSPSFGDVTKSVVIQDCPNLNADATLRLLELETRSLSHVEAARVQLGCNETRMTISVAWQQDLLTRTIDLLQVEARAHPRIVALTVVEMLDMLVTSLPAASRPEPVLASDLTVADAAPPLPAASAARNQTAFVEAGPVMRWLPALGTWHSGLRLGARIAFEGDGGRTSRGLRVWGQIEGGGRALDYGQGELLAPSLGAALVWQRAGRLSPWLAAGVEAGIAFMNATPTEEAQGQPHRAPFASPLLEAGLGFAFAPRWRCAASVTAGYTVAAAVAHGVDARSGRFGMLGAWFVPNISLAWRL